MSILAPSSTPGTAAPPAGTAPLTLEAALAAVAGWHDLPPARRRDLASRLATIGRLANLPPAAVLLTPAALRAQVLDRSASAYGLSEGTLRNLRWGLRAVLRRLNVIDDLDGPLTPAWAAQLDHLDRLRRAGLVSFARFCSGRGIPPEAVSDPVLQAFEAWLTTRTLTRLPAKAAGAVRTGWNRACRLPGWAGPPLGRRQRAGQYVLPLEAFPASFQADLAAFGRWIGGAGLDDLGPDEDDTAPLPQRMLRPSTVALRQSHLRWAASALVASGVPVAELATLASLVTPLERAKRAIRFLYERAGQRPSAAGQHVAEALRIIARHYVGLPPEQVAEIRRWQQRVALTYRGMTEHNERQVREMMQPDRLERLRALPEALMTAARQLRASNPLQARSLSLRAVAIGILSRIPLRLANLAGLRLDRHLHRPDPRRGTVTHLLIPAGEVKNKRPISLPVSREVAQLIEEWVADYRPLPLPDCPYLFPGYGPPGQPIGHQGLRNAVKDSMRTHVGVALTPHQFRHLAARLFLDTYPGHYEEVRQLLGHASVATTTRHYSGIENEAAARRYDAIILGAAGPDRPARDAARRARAPRREPG